LISNYAEENKASMINNANVKYILKYRFIKYLLIMSYQTKMNSTFV